LFLLLGEVEDNDNLDLWWLPRQVNAGLRLEMACLTICEAMVRITAQTLSLLGLHPLTRASKPPTQSSLDFIIQQISIATSGHDSQG